MMDTSIPAPDPFGIDDALKGAFASGKLVVPPMPAVALELKRRIEDARSSASDLARVIGADPALTGTVLRMANAGSTSPVSTVSAAIARVGTKSLVALVMSAALADSANKAGPLGGLRRQVWREAVVSALLAHDIGPSYGLSAEEAFLCGLMHDVGRLVALASAEHVLQRRDDLGVMPSDIWMIHIDRHHLPFGMEVAAGWNLPSPVLEAIRDHHALAPTPVPTAPEEAAPSLMARVDQLLGLLQARSSLDRAEVMALGGVDARMAEHLEAILAGLPGRVAAFMGEVTTKRSKRTSASWACPPQIFGEEARATDLPITVFRGGQPVPCRLTAVAPHGLRLRSPLPLTSGYLAKGELTEPSPMSLHFIVESTLESAGSHQVDARPFSLSRDQQRLWQQLLHDEAGAAVSA